MNVLLEFAVSSNGDRWILGTDATTQQPSWVTGQRALRRPRNQNLG